MIVRARSWRRYFHNKYLLRESINLYSYCVKQSYLQNWYNGRRGEPREKLNIPGFFCIFFLEIFTRSSDFVNSVDCVGKITSKSVRLQPVFIQKRFEVNKKWEIEVIISMTMLPRSSERIFNPMRCTGNMYEHVDQRVIMTLNIFKF